MENYNSREFRLGSVFNIDKLNKLKNDLNSLSLPNIPYDITLDEIQVLLAYQGNMLAYLHSNLEILNMEEKKQEVIFKNIYNEVYKSIENTNSNNKITTIKNITANNTRVLTAQKKLIDIQSAQSQITAQINALQEQNVSLRKIASIKIIAIQSGIE